MMIKRNGEYFDFNDTLEVERKVKLFEEIDTADGDFSYASSMPKTGNNLRLLDSPFPDNKAKTVFMVNETIVCDDTGNELYRGALRVESITDVINFSFFSGNSNWFALLSGNMTELRLDKYNIDLNEATITGSWLQTNGIVFPFLDTGTLITRGFNNAKNEDFVGAFYLHTLFKEVFQQSNIKIEGELLSDPLFNQLIIVTNTRSVTDVNANSVNVATKTPVPVSSLGSDFIEYDLTSSPYSVGADVVIVSNRDFYASAKMVAQITVTTLSDSEYFNPQIYVNGSLGSSNVISSSRSSDAANHKISQTWIVDLNEGDYTSIFIINLFGGTVTLLESTLKITPLFIYKAFGRSCVPLWTKQQFVSNVLRLFNVVPSFNQFTKTVTLNYFDKIADKDPIDISEFISVDQVDYSEFISSYGKSNNFSYAEGSDEDLNEYNISSFVKYGAGTIQANNDFIENSADVLDSEFTTPISYLNPAFNGSLEMINFVEVEELDDYEITSVTDSGGTPRFNIANADDFFQQNDLIRLDTDQDEYNGDFVVVNTTSTYLTVRGLVYTANGTGTGIKLQHKVTTDDSVYLFVQIPYTDTNDLFDRDETTLNQQAYDSWSLAFFSLIRLGHQIESEYKQSLSFGEINNPSFFQRTLLSRYWKQFESIINDPVMLLCTGYYPLSVYNSIDFLRPIQIKTKETTNLYYINRLTGYKGSHLPCTTELIKLS